MKSLRSGNETHVKMCLKQTSSFDGRRIARRRGGIGGTALLKV
jgi:hypothetical protein